jgi:filamentous hemagglutinin family protein
MGAVQIPRNAVAAPGFSRATLLGRASTLALLVAGAVSPSPALAGPFRSLSQALAAAGKNGTAGNIAGQATQAAQQASLGTQNLAKAAAQFRTLQDALTAQEGSADQVTVPNGVGAGGLDPASGYNTPGAADQWIGVSTTQPLTQSQNGNAVTVTVNQAKSQAVLDWNSFNIGRNTTLVFNQTAGGAAASTWSVLNRVENPDLTPSYILGSIKAAGQVLVLDQNGVLFGNNAQVDLHSLVAGAVSMTNSQYLTYGLTSQTGTQAAGGSVYSGYLPSFTDGSGTVTVEPGAVLQTTAPASASDGGGSIILLGSRVENEGQISTPDGQTILGAGRDFALQDGYSVPPSGSATTGNPTSTVLGQEIETDGDGSIINRGVIQSTTGDITLVANIITQYGVLYATTGVNQRGTIHLLENTVNSYQLNTTGAILPPAGEDYSATVPGTITLAAGSVTEILPDPSGSTALASAQQAGYAAQLAYGTTPADLPRFIDQAQTTDRPGVSRIEITTGGIVDFADNSLTLAPAGQIAVTAAGSLTTLVNGNPVTTATGQAFVAAGAQLDVAGLAGVTLPMSDDVFYVDVNIQGFGLADSPQNRDSHDLNSNTVPIELQDLIYVAPSAIDPQARDYTAGGLLQVSGQLGLIPGTIAQWSTIGGQITLNAQGVIAQPGSSFNIAGGSVNYQSGYVPQAYVMGADGVLYNINTAPGNLTYTGVYKGTVEAHPRWNISQTFINPLLTPSSVYEQGYVQGRDAGALVLDTPSAAFEGTINGSVTTGPNQTAVRQGAAVDPFLLTQQTAPLAGSFSYSGALAGSTQSTTLFATDVLISSSTPTLASKLKPGSELPADLIDTLDLGAPQLDGLGSVTINAGNQVEIPKAGAGTYIHYISGSITDAGGLTLAPGGTLTLEAPSIKIDAPITVRGGAVTLTTEAQYATSGDASVDRGSIDIGHVTINTTGLWTNLLQDPADRAGIAFVNGGNVTLLSDGTIRMAAGSLIDASAGAVYTGTLAGGHGGNITLTADDPALQETYIRKSQQAAQPVILDGTVRSLGVTAGGIFSLTAPSVLIGPDPVVTGDTQVALPDSFFSSGFSAYAINGFATAPSVSATVALGTVATGVVVQPNAVVMVVEPVLQLPATGTTAPTGTDPESALQTTLLQLYLANPAKRTLTQRPGASLMLTAGSPQGTLANSVVAGGGITVSAGATITVDPGQNVTLSTPSELIVDGTINAPSGTIALINTTENEGPTVAGDGAGLSVWVGPTAVLNASAQAFTAADLAGRPFGVVPAGGTIEIGSLINTSDLTDEIGTDAFVFIRPGAVIEAAGTSAVIDPIPALSGAAADPAIDGARLVASNGGTIGFASGNSVFLGDQTGTPTITASAGGAGAAGGTLDLRLETQFYSVGDSSPPTSLPQVPNWYLTPHEILLGDGSQTAIATVLPGSAADQLTPGDARFIALLNQYTSNGTTVSGEAVDGQAVLSTGLISAGGFDSISLVARDQIAFDGSVALTARQSISLVAYTFSETPNAAGLAGQVSINAPYVKLAGAPALPTGPEYVTPALSAGGEDTYNQAGSGFSKLFAPCFGAAAAGCTDASLQVNASLIDVGNNVRFGDEIVIGNPVSAGPGGGNTGTATISQTLDVPGFDLVTLNSAGDLRFVPGATGTVTLESSGDITLDAAQIYPATSVSATIAAGLNPFGTVTVGSFTLTTLTLFTDGVLSIGRTTQRDPAPPLSVFGSLLLDAATIDQDGILSAPLGSISFGRAGGTLTLPDDLQFGPDSVTSVSAAGLTIPYGGTTDGVTYSYDGTPLTFNSASYGNGSGQPKIQIEAVSTDVSNGATLDLSGGGTLTGGGGELLTGGTVQVSSNGTVVTLANGTLTSQGFISGRGGSVDTLTAPFASFNSKTLTYTQPTLSQEPVYAIVPSLGLSAAPVTPLDSNSLYYGSLPLLGQQVTIGAGVPGLPAGTYTLLPSYYALLPGGFRVQVNGTAGVTDTAGAVANGTGSYVIDGFQTDAFGGAAIQSTAPVGLIVTPAAVVRALSQYDEESYTAFATAQAAIFGNSRAFLPQDGGHLAFEFAGPSGLEPNGTLTPAAAIPLTFDGTALLDGAAGGYGGLVTVEGDPNLSGSLNNIEILAAGQAPTAGMISVTAASLNALAAPLLLIGGNFDTVLGAEQTASANTTDIVLRSGATLTANAVWLLANTNVTLEPGATISTLGYSGIALPDSSTGVALSPANAGPQLAAVVVANGTYTIIPGTGGNSVVNVGVCATGDSCAAAPVGLFSNGLAGVFASTNVDIASGTQFGARELILGVPEIDIGTPAAGQSTPQAALSLSQAELAALFDGNTALGTPALQVLNLEASQSLNFYGTTSLDALQGGQSAQQTLVLTTPAIYGAGGPGDVASFTAGNLVWNSIAGATPGPVLGHGPGTGTGTLLINAQNITLGYPVQAQAQDQTALGRLILGFSDVVLTATQSITGNNDATLSVYEAQGKYTHTGSYVYTGGNLTLDTPLLTTAPGAVVTYSTGGTVTLAGVAGVAASTASGGLGGEIDIDAASINDTTRISLPSGKLVLDASGDVTLGAGAVIDLTGPLVPFFDVSQGSSGGTLQIQSTAGNIVQAAGATIDVSAQSANAGTVSLTALAGSVTLDGTLSGGATGTIDYGTDPLTGAAVTGTYAGGALDVSALSLGDTLTLNQILYQGGFTLTRDLELAGPVAGGTLLVSAGTTLAAQNVSISVDQAALDIEGTIDASGATPGSIRLAGSDGLTLGAASVLDAQGTVLQCASGPCSLFGTDTAQNQPVDALNTAHIELTVPTTVNGAANPAGLTIATGATIDMSSPDGAARGDLEIDVPRTSATSGDANISADGSIAITGAANIDVNAFWAYSPDSDPSALAGGVITQASLTSFDADSAAFIKNALAGTLIGGQLAGLAAYSDAFHLRPGVEIDSSADANGGTLTVQGDLDLSGERYTSVNPILSQAGFGEAGVLWVRASGGLNINGSINDGFADPTVTLADQQWVLYAGQQTVTTVLPAGLPNGKITLQVGTSFAAVPMALNYNITVVPGALLNQGATLPVPASLETATAVPAFVATSTIAVPGGPTYYAGEQVPAQTLPAGTRFEPGNILPVEIPLAGLGGATDNLTLPAGTSLALFDTTYGSLALATAVVLTQGDIIPVNADLLFANNAGSVQTRPDGENTAWALSAMLPAGDPSWSLRLVSGADLAAADSRVVTPGSAGNLVLSDTHYITPHEQVDNASLGFSVVRTGTGYLDLLSGGAIDIASPYGIYTAGTQTGGAATINFQPAYFTSGGGDVLVSANGNLTGYTYVLGPLLAYDPSAETANSDAVGNWLAWNSNQNGAEWAVSFGTAEDLKTGGGQDSAAGVTGFTGIGALGGGNVTVLAGGAAGQIAAPQPSIAEGGGYLTGTPLDITVASTGQANAQTGSETLTGGGRITVAIGGDYNPGALIDNFSGQYAVSDDIGVIADLRGPIALAAGAVGVVVANYPSLVSDLDPRASNPFVAEYYASGGGPALELGDATANLQARGDLALSGVGDPTYSNATTLYSATTGNPIYQQGTFSLWQDNTAVSLETAGGNLAPFGEALSQAGPLQTENGGNDFFYPPVLNATAFSGSIYAGIESTSELNPLVYLAPSPLGNLTFLAGTSISDLPFLDVQEHTYEQANISLSGAPADSVPTPLDPTPAASITDFATGTLHVGDTMPTRFYAVTGDVVGLLTGYVDPTVPGDVVAAKAVQVEAGRDIVSFGASSTTPNYILNNNASDVSSLIAGRDIIYANADIAGPGLLYVQAGRNIYQGDIADLTSVGEIADALTPATRNDGAGITVLAGTGAAGPNYTAFAVLYLNPDNLANPNTPLQNQPGRVVRTYQVQLAAWLLQRFGYAAPSPAAALAYFLALPVTQQQAFLLGIYFAELNQSGLDYNNPASRFYRSYLEGQAAIAALFPATDQTGQSPPTGGSLTLFSGAATVNGTATTLDAGIHTEAGGGITTLVPYGDITLGNYGVQPGAGAGIVTQGSGDINIYSYGSVILGQSRILTTFGGNVLIWMSSNGEINAGRGSNTTQIASPVGIIYDDYGNIELTPDAPANGAGIGALAPIPSVPPGDVNLIAPVGTIDAGEAGIRASGSANLAALTVVNGANVSSGGKTTGLPTVSGPSAAAETAASTTGGAAQQANALQTAARPATSPSVLDVDVISIGGSYDDERKRKKAAARG